MKEKVAPIHIVITILNNIKMESKLVTPTVKFIDYILNSWHYLNDPKCELNYHLDCMYRQGIVEGKQKAIENVEFYLQKYEIQQPHKTAVEFVEWRLSIGLQEFEKINVNSYLNNLPPHVVALDKRVNDWMKDHTTFYPYKVVKGYPFKYN